MENIQFKHSCPIQLRFNDADALGHVNNSTYLSYFDLGKTEYFKTVKGVNYFEVEIDIVIAHIDVDFIKSVFLRDDVAVETTVTHIGNKSLTIAQRIVSRQNGEVKCLSNTTMVGVDFKTGKTTPISQQWRNEIAAYENRPEFAIKPE